MLKYYRLFDVLNRKEMKKTDLLDILSSKTIAKLSKGENINSEIIDKICSFLKCQPEDIMEYIEVGNGKDMNTGEKYIIVKKPHLEDETEEEIYEADDYEEMNLNI